MESILLNITQDLELGKKYRVTYSPRFATYTQEFEGLCPNIFKKHTSNNNFLRVSQKNITVNCFHENCGPGRTADTKKMLATAEPFNILFGPLQSLETSLLTYMQSNGIDRGVTRFTTNFEGCVAATTDFLSSDYDLECESEHLISPYHHVIRPRTLPGTPTATRAHRKVDLYTESSMYNSVHQVFVINNTSNVIINHITRKDTPQASALSIQAHPNTHPLACIKGQLNNAELEEALLVWFDFPTQHNLAFLVSVTHGASNIIAHSGNYSLYNGKIWEVKHPKYVKHAIMVILHDVWNDLNSVLIKACVQEHIVKATKAKFIAYGSDANSIGLLSLCAGYLDVPHIGEKFDRDWNLLPFSNGVYDLKERVLRDFRKKDYLTMHLQYDYNPNVCSKYIDEFLLSLMPNKDQREFLLWTCALMMSGKNGNTKLHFFIGSGSNGKSLFLHLLSRTLGPYCSVSHSSILTRSEKDPNSPRPELLKLRNVRCSFISEPEERNFKSSIVKRFCGNDMVSGRNLYNAEIAEFRMRTNFIVLSNTPPTFSTNDDALWHRIIMISFDQKFVVNPQRPGEQKADPTIMSKIDNDDDILASFINVLITFHQLANVEAPESFKRLVNSHRQHECSLSIFLSAHLVLDKNSVTKIRIIQEAYLTSMGDSNESQNTNERSFVTQINAYIHTHYAKESVSYGVHRTLCMMPPSKTAVFRNVRGWKGLTLEES